MARQKWTDLRHITRLEYGRTNAWWVRFQRGFVDGKRKVISKLFSYSKHGGKAKALRIAIIWRDMKRHQLPPGLSRGPKAVPVGTLKVTYNSRSYPVDGGRRVARQVVATLKVSVSPSRSVRAIRSVDLWGREKATRLAIQGVKSQQPKIATQAPVKRLRG